MLLSISNFVRRMLIETQFKHKLKRLIVGRNVLWLKDLWCGRETVPVSRYQKLLVYMKNMQDLKKYFRCRWPKSGATCRVHKASCRMRYVSNAQELGQASAGGSALRSAECPDIGYSTMHRQRICYCGIMSQLCWTVLMPKFMSQGSFVAAFWGTGAWKTGFSP